MFEKDLRSRKFTGSENSRFTVLLRVFLNIVTDFAVEVHSTGIFQVSHS